MAYSDDALRQLLEIWRSQEGVLSLDELKALYAWRQTPKDVREQMEALYAWSQTPEDVREALRTAINERRRKSPRGRAAVPIRFGVGLLARLRVAAVAEARRWIETLPEE